MKEVIFKLNLISKYISMLFILLSIIIINLDGYIFPNFKIPSILYLTHYSNFKIVTMNTLVFTMLAGLCIWILTIPYWVLNIVSIVSGQIDRYSNIQKLYENFDKYSKFFLILLTIPVFYFILFYLNYVGLFQINIPFAPKSMISGISESKFFLFLFSVFFNIIGIGYCINILIFILFFLFLRILKG